MLPLRLFPLLLLLFLQKPVEEKLQNREPNNLRGNIKILLSEGKSVLKEFPDSSYRFAAEAAQKSLQINDSSLLLESLHLEFIAKKSTAQYNEAIRIYEYAASIALGIKDSSTLWVIKNDLGQLCLQKGDYANALTYAMQSLQIAEKLCDKKNIAESNRSVAIVLKTQQNYIDAIKYLTKSLDLWYELKDTVEVTRTIVNIGGNLAITGQLDKSLDYLFQGEKYATKLKDTILLSNIIIAIANVYNLKKDFPQVEVYYGKAIALKKSLNDKKGLATIYNNMCVFYLKNSNYKKGQEYAELALKYAKETNLLNVQMSSCKSLSYLYAKEKSFDKAYRFQNLYIQIKDSLFSIQKAEQIAEIKAKYEDERKEQQIKILESENQIKEVVIQNSRLVRNSLVGGVVLLILIIALIFGAYINKRKMNLLLKGKNKQIELQKADLRSQNEELNRLNLTKDRLFSIIAHDLRSPMSSMMGLSTVVKELLQEGNKEAIEAITVHIDHSVNNVNSLLENLLNWSLSQINGIRVNSEIVNLRNTVNSSVSNFESIFEDRRIRVDISIDDELTVRVDPNMLRTVMRNILSNSIKFTPSEGLITISASRVDGYANVRIKDTGVGIPPSKMDNIFEVNEKKISAGIDGTRGTGLGLSLCKDFIALNNGHIGIKSEVDKGTEVYFSLPCL
ncbi:MAG: ATP-binding protein [Bacteroidales bacterium]